MVCNGRWQRVVAVPWLINIFKRHYLFPQERKVQKYKTKYIKYQPSNSLHGWESRVSLKSFMEAYCSKTYCLIGNCMTATFCFIRGSLNFLAPLPLSPRDARLGNTCIPIPVRVQTYPISGYTGDMHPLLLCLRRRPSDLLWSGWLSVVDPARVLAALPAFAPVRLASVLAEELQSGHVVVDFEGGAEFEWQTRQHVQPLHKEEWLAVDLLKTKEDFNYARSNTA